MTYFMFWRAKLFTVRKGVDDDVKSHVGIWVRLSAQQDFGFSYALAKRLASVMEKAANIQVSEEMEDLFSVGAFLKGEIEELPDSLMPIASKAQEILEEFPQEDVKTLVIELFVEEEE